MSIAANIKKLRKQYGITQAELGEIAGVTDKAVSAWETELSSPQMPSIQKIADHFGLTKSDIVEDKTLPYLNDEIITFATEIQGNPELYRLHQLVHDMDKYDLEFVVELLTKIKRLEPQDDPEIGFLFKSLNGMGKKDMALVVDLINRLQK